MQWDRARSPASAARHAVVEMRAWEIHAMDASEEKYRRILGVRFFTGGAAEAVALGLGGGLMVAPSAPVLVGAAEDPATQAALLDSDLAITDSGLMILMWRLLRREKLVRVSGLEYLKLLLREPALRERGAVLWIMPGEDALLRNIAWLRQLGCPVGPDDCYIAPQYPPGPLADPLLLSRINAARPAHVIMAIGGGVQERLGHFLKKNAEYRPAIHCTGAAIGFLSGDQIGIPVWADRFFLGWLFRCLSAPHRFIPRYWKAAKLISMMIGNRSSTGPTLAQ